jgi:hypothetical protein
MSGMPNPFTTLGSDPDDQPEEKTTFPISDEERTLLVKSEAFVYKIPPQVNRSLKLVLKPDIWSCLKIL